MTDSSDANPITQLASQSFRGLRAHPLERAWPRPFVSYPNHSGWDPVPLPPKLPVPWVNTDPVYRHEDWLTFDADAQREAQENDFMLCGICGFKLGRYKVMGVMCGERRETTGPAMHARCAVFCTKFCPHFIRFEGKPFFVYEGEGCGLDLGDFDALDQDNESADLTLVGVDAEAWRASTEEVKALIPLDTYPESD